MHEHEGSRRLGQVGPFTKLKWLHYLLLLPGIVSALVDHCPLATSITKPVMMAAVAAQAMVSEIVALASQAAAYDARDA